MILGKLTSLLWILGRPWYMKARIWYLRHDGVIMQGTPRFIHPSARLDTLGGVTLGDKVTISAGAFILTHDYAITQGLRAANHLLLTDVAVFDSVFIGDNCFIGLGSILLPGTALGKDVIVGAGSVVRGTIPSNSVVIGNPAAVIARTNEWALRCLHKNREKLHYDKDCTKKAIVPDDS